MITSKKPVRYDNVTISDNNDLTNKIYVDTSIASYIPDKIQNTSTFLETTSSSINIDV